VKDDTTLLHQRVTMGDACDACGPANEALDCQGNFQQASFLWNNAESFRLKLFAGKCLFWQFFYHQKFSKVIQKSFSVTNFLIPAYFHCV